MNALPREVPAIRSGLRLTNVEKAYVGLKGQTVLALSNISLDVEPGRFVAIVGRSGCGKSTLLRIAAGLIASDAGRVEVDGNDIAGPPEQVRYVFQDYAQSLLPWKTVDGNIAFGLRHAAPGSFRRWSVDELLGLIGLSHVGDRYPSELSGGMQQRLAIGRALASQPRILLMDEPFSAVDALSRANLQDMLLSVWRQFGLTILFVTHDVEEAIYLADRVIVLHPRGHGIASSTQVDLPRPREQIATRELDAYLKLRRQILAQVIEPSESP